MTAALIILAALVLVGGMLYLLYRRDIAREGADSAPVRQPGRPEGCCGQHEVCELSSLIVDESQPPEYYDDEELDRFRGRTPDAYSPAEEEEFREVLLTLRPAEVAPWGRSLQQRGLEMPSAVKDEFLMLVGEMRMNPPSTP